MISLCGYFVTCFLLFHASLSTPAAFADGDDPTERVVRDCIQLQDALISEDVTRVMIAGQIDCRRDSWQVPVIVQRNVEITSATPSPPQSQNATAESMEDEERPFVHWRDLSHVVIVERAALNVHDLLMKQSDFGVGGLTLAFVHTREGAAAVFAGVVVVAESCSETARSYRTMIEQIDRPNFLAGEQLMSPIGSDVLFVQDVAIWWPNLRAVWQLCNSFLVCSRGSRHEIPVDQYFESGFVTNSCAAGDRINVNLLRDTFNVTANTDMEDEPTDEDDASDGGMPQTTSTVIIVAAATVVVIFFAALFSYKCIVMHTQPVKSPHLRRDHGSIGHDESDITSSRHLNNKNDVDLDLFGCGRSVPLQDVVIGSLLGRGGFGKVYKGTWKGTAVAIKVIEHGERLLQNELKLPFEAYLSRHISHPNVVQTFLIHTRQKDSANGITVDTLDLQTDSPESAKKNASVTSVDIFSNLGPNMTYGRDAGELFQTWLVLEFCDRGSLSKAIRKGELMAKDISAPLLDHILLSALDVANAMNYLHSLGITHGDLKAENVLLKSASTDRRGFFCKVSDFGLSRYVGDDDYLQTFTYGTITHMPPELLKNGVFSTAVDIYSFGVLLWELLSTTPPYPDTNHGHILMTVVNEGRRPKIANHYPTPYADLIRDCWKQNPDDRPDFSAIVKRLKQMLADFEINNTLMKTDEPTESASPLRSGETRSTKPYLSTMSSNHSSDSVSQKPSVVFASERSSIPHRDVQAESAHRDQSHVYSTDSDGASLSTTPRSLSSEFSEFNDA